jgi:hypothetical protein
MSAHTPFQGLTMPVFTAFGWAGEDQAMKFALSQLDAFIARLHAHMSSDLRTIFPYFGIDRGGQVVYVSEKEEATEGVHIAFRASPMNFTVTLGVTDKKSLAKVFGRLNSAGDDFYKRAKLLGEGWEMRLQQMEIMDDAGTEISHYQDVFKDEIVTLDEENAGKVIERGEYLNNEAKWVAPLYFNHRENSEKIAFMGVGVVRHMAEFLRSVLPMARLMTGVTGKKVMPAKAPKKPRATAEKSTSAKDMVSAQQLEQFVFVSEVKELHIRKGFVNLTAEHWPFFAKTARANTREIDLKFGEGQSQRAGVWRLVSNGQARLVLEGNAAKWLGETFSSNERVQVEAIKGESGDIVVSLTPVA